MINWNIMGKLLRSFPNSFVNAEGEFIAHKKAGEYFIIKNCETEFDVQCKVLERLSRAAYKTDPFRGRKNEEFHEFMRAGINEFLGTSFTLADMEKIYVHLGNAVDQVKTVWFIESGFDMNVLEKPHEKN